MADTEEADPGRAGMLPASALFDATLPVSAAGYRWASGWHDERDDGWRLGTYRGPGRPPDSHDSHDSHEAALGTPVRVLVPRPTADDHAVARRTVDVFASGDLHRQLAALSPDEDQLVAFADRYGTLSNVRFAVDNHPAAWSRWPGPDPDDPLVAAEPITTWIRESRRMRVLCAFWDGQRLELDDTLEPPAHLTDWRRRPRLHDVWLPYARQLERADTDAAFEAEQGRQFVEDAVDREVRGGTELRLGRGSGGLRVRPRTLLDAIYLSFAREIAAAQGTPTCLVCGEAIIDAERITRRYCSPRCKTRAQRARRDSPSAVV